MINGYYEFDKLEDVQAYINEVLDPAALNSGKEISYVVIERKTYDIFPIHKNERDTFYDLSAQAKDELKQRADGWVLAAQRGVDPLLTEVRGWIDTIKVNSRLAALNVKFDAIPAGAVVDRVQWYFEKSPKSGVFDTYNINCIPSEIKDAEPMTKANADTVFNSNSWVKFKWVYDDGGGAQEYTGALSNLLFGYEGAQQSEDINILVKARVTFSTRQEVWAFGFITIPANA